MKSGGLWLVRRCLLASLLLLLAPPLLAGLRFTPAPGPSGGDVASLAGDGVTLWAGSSRGVWRLSSGAWIFDGLSNQTVAAVGQKLILHAVAVAEQQGLAHTHLKIFPRRIELRSETPRGPLEIAYPVIELFRL